MVGYLVVAVICLIAGGYGGYTWGRSVEAKAQAVVSAAKQGVDAIGAAVKK